MNGQCLGYNMKGLSLSKGGTFIVVPCAHLGRSYLLNPAFSVLRMLAEQGQKINIRDIEALTSSNPFKIPHNITLWTRTEKIQHYMKSKQDDSEYLFQLHAIYTPQKWSMKHDHCETPSPCLFLLSVLYFLLFPHFPFSALRPLPFPLLFIPHCQSCISKIFVSLVVGQS